jgi:hypothetical protein
MTPLCRIRPDCIETYEEREMRPEVVALRPASSRHEFSFMVVVACAVLFLAALGLAMALS